MDRNEEIKLIKIKSTNVNCIYCNQIITVGVYGAFFLNNVEICFLFLFSIAVIKMIYK